MLNISILFILKSPVKAMSWLQKNIYHALQNKESLLHLKALWHKENG